MLAEIFVKLSLLSVFAVIVWVVIAGLLNRRLASDMEREYTERTLNLGPAENC